MVFVGDVIDPESQGTKSGEENARRRPLIFFRSKNADGRESSDKNWRTKEAVGNLDNNRLWLLYSNVL